MAIPSLPEDLELALRIADATARIAIRHYERAVAVSAKEDGSPVTEADHWRTQCRMACSTVDRLLADTSTFSCER